MSDHHRIPTHPKARKEHRCIYCGGPIVVGEQYTQQTGYYDGEAYTNRYHAECFDDCAEEFRQSGDWEFTPHSAEYPDRVQAIVDARHAAIAKATGSRP